MTLEMTLEHNHIWKCDICGKKETWSDSWWAYGSICHSETCPGDMPSACSDECKAVLEQKIKSHEFVLPILKRIGPHYNVLYERHGY